jgi:hypothetical protein
MLRESFLRQACACEDTVLLYPVVYEGISPQLNLIKVSLCGNFTAWH